MSNSIIVSFPSPLASLPTPLLLNSKSPNAYLSFPLPNQTLKPNLRVRVSKSLIRCRKPAAEMDSSSSVDCIGTGSDVECLATEASESDRLVQSETSTSASAFQIEGPGGKSDLDFLYGAWDWMLLISPFFFWGTAMVAMKEVLPKAGPFFVSAFRLIPAGAILIGFALSRGRKQPSGIMAWVWILLFGAVDAACFQVIIDSQPLTVAILAALLFGESIGLIGAAGLVVGVIGLLLLEVPSLSFKGDYTLWGSGEWWMLLAAQSMAVGTVMVRWVSKYSDPIMATGWHMVVGGIPLLAISVFNHDPAINGGLKEFTSGDILALLYTSVFGSAVSYGVFFYNATKGSLTKLSSLTFLTPMFASVFGFIYLGETFSPLQLLGAFVTIAAIYMVNYQSITDEV